MNAILAFVAERHVSNKSYYNSVRFWHLCPSSASRTKRHAGSVCDVIQDEEMAVGLFQIEIFFFKFILEASSGLQWPKVKFKWTFGIFSAIHINIVLSN